MRNLHFVGVGIIALGLLAGCHAGSTPSVLPLVGSAVHSRTGSCSPAGGGATITVCVRIPQSSIDVTVKDSVYGDAGIGSVQCPGTGSAYLCIAGFQAPAGTLNQIEVDASRGENASGSFPREAGSKPVTVTLGGAIHSIALVPFQSTTTNLGAPSSLALGQVENVWVVAKDQNQEIIVGKYQPAISISTTSSNLKHSLKVLNSSADAEQLNLYWAKNFVGSSYAASLQARTSTGLTATPAPISATSGVVYYHVGTNDSTFGPGPVAVAPSGRYLYIVVNDDSDGGCRAPGQCKGLLERFDLKTQTFAKPVPLKNVPGVSQLYVSSTNGTLWMATFQPTGTWNYPLPGLRLPENEFKPNALQTMPPDFGEPSGFTADPSGNLWISSCKGNPYCKQDQNGSPILVKTSISGTGTPHIIDLPRTCMAAGYFGYSVGDVAYYKGDVYVLGLNDGSGPPAHGNIWRVSPAKYGSRCPKVPSNFNPSPYFSTMVNSAGAEVLVFGAGGNNVNFRWQPDHGFYILSETSSDKNPIVWDNGPGVTANHVAASLASPSPSGPGRVLYYASSGKLDLRFSGLGTYQPSSSPASSPSPWSIFPSASFSGDQSDNGVAVASDGAWYTANGVCGDWRGVCLAHAIYLPNWGVLPSLNVPAIGKGNSAGFGVITNPQGPGSWVRPFNVHSGPFYAQTTPSNVCSVQLVSNLTFSVTGLTPGACQITIQERKGSKVVLSQPLVTSVK